MLENQFHRYFETAERKKGITGENLLQLLERRLDNVIYRMGSGASRPQARELVRHGHVRVNGKKVNIPSYLVDVNDVITVARRAASTEHFKALREGTGRGDPAVDRVVDSREPRGDHHRTARTRGCRSDDAQENLIVELYSR